MTGDHLGQDFMWYKFTCNTGDWKTQVWTLGKEETLKEEMATHSNILAWEIPWREEPGGVHSMESQKSWIWLSN